MPKPRKHVFVCRNTRDPATGRKSCELHGGADIYEEFRRLRKEAGIAEEIKLTKVKCLGKCEHGPNAVVYPDNVWYCGLKPEDVRRIVYEHLVNDKPVIEKLLADELI